ncbi:MAG: hypothetical protein ABR591_10425 [Candidatus Velthaea sp.]
MTPFSLLLFATTGLLLISLAVAGVASRLVPAAGCGRCTSRRHPLL